MTARWLLFACFLAATALFADSWAPPTERIFSSANGKYLLYVSPKASPELPEDLQANDEAGTASERNQGSWASLFAKDEETSTGFSKDAFRPIWHQKLVNEVAPMNAFISNDGKFVITTDDYAHLGYGENVVVIYGSDGKLVRRFRLTAFLSEAEIQNAPRSVSSIYWAGDHQIDTQNECLLLQVWQSGGTSETTPPVFKTVRIRLATGNIVVE